MIRRSGRPARTLTGLLTAVVLLTASGCGLLGDADAESGAAAGPAPEKAKIKIGLLPIVDVASVHIAIKKGYFNEEGLEVEPVTVQGGAAAIPALINGDLDVTFGNWVSFFAAQAKDDAKSADGLKLIADGYQAKTGMFMILGKANSGFKSPRDLEGKTIALNTFNNIAELTAKATLEGNDVDLNKVTFKAMPMPDMEAAIESGVVDAGFMSEPFITRAQRNAGQIPFLYAASGPTDGIPIAGYGTTGKFAQQNPNTVAAFQRAMVKGQRDAADHATVQSLLVDYAKVDRDTATLVHFGEYPTSLDLSRLQRVSNLMRTYGLLQNDFDVKPMLVTGRTG
ncbi:ABC transporter substrate-binding protein [Umezawaea endophytica]|uniref:ABC transporter substrate-binding protein n=1 Tax=Umezawaea endophytica TaxID=1654476 RepID=A0A9X2VFP2_9PSEU|nr:ABC transporter substrate-binding protein [Umezawaea endophytica]MCS7475594.1 ABC transporter substrate-binding protein [Umezawaea endophytica]